MRGNRNIFRKIRNKTRHTCQQTARRANHRPPAQGFPSRLLQKLRPQHQAFDPVGSAFDLVGVVGEVNAPDHGAALQHGGRAPQLQILDQRDAVALGEQRAARQIFIANFTQAAAWLTSLESQRNFPASFDRRWNQVDHEPPHFGLYWRLLVCRLLQA